jgi:hypothetical protein
MTTVDLDDRVPIRFDPLPGEAFDSWLAAYAARLNCPIPELARAVGIPGTVFGLPAANLALGRPAPDPQRVALAACGLGASQIEATWLPLARYAQQVKARLGMSDLARAARPMPWSRYCPKCLAGNGGRWPAAWRLPWFVACPRHRRFLLSACPSCGGAQRLRRLRHDCTGGSSALCSARQPEGAGAGWDCHHDLGAVKPGPGPPAGLLAWQRQMAAVLDPGIDGDSLSQLVDRLADQLVVARHLGLHGDSLDTQGLADTAHLATLLLRAHRLQSDRTGAEMAELALADANKRTWVIPRSWRPASAELTAVVLRHRDSRLCTPARLRYRTATELAARPGRHDAQQRQACVPLAIWPDWAIRLTPTSGLQLNSFRAVTAIAICLAGTSQSLNNVTRLWCDDRTFHNEVARGLQLIGRDPDGKTIIAALTMLAEHLDRHGAPIDYPRRDHFAASVELIDADSWDGICQAAGTATGGTAKLRAARLWIWETITGGEPHQAPEHIRPLTNGQLNRYHRFALDLPATAATLLDQRARAVLDRYGCADEPLTWSPPPGVIDVAGLPGRDPHSVDAADARRLLRQNLAEGTVAERLGITLGHLRYIVRRNPPEVRPRSAGKRAVMRHPKPTHLTAERLRDLIDNGGSVRGIATQNGVTRKIVRDELIRHGIDVPVPGRQQLHGIDPEWLRHQYLVELRTLGDLAAEIGATPSTLSRHAQAHGIPLRARGGASHQSSLTAGRGYSHPLALAVLGQGGVERVRRFQIYASMRSLNAAAIRTGLYTTVLISQLNQLESACGGQLIERSPTEQQPQQLTDLGRQLLRQADRHLGPNPDAPPTLPEPLAAAIKSFWGPSRLERFLTTVSCRTIAEAAQRMGTDAHTLLRSIRGLGDATGGPLLIDAPPRAQLRLTPLGRKLRRQAELHVDDLDLPGNNQL